MKIFQPIISGSLTTNDGITANSVTITGNGTVLQTGVVGERKGLRVDAAAAATVWLGDWEGNDNGTQLVVDDSLSLISLQSAESRIISPIVKLADFQKDANGTSIIIDDNLSLISTTGSVEIIGSLTLNGGVIQESYVVNDINLSSDNFGATKPGVYVISVGDKTGTYVFRGIDAGLYPGQEFTIINTDPTNEAYFDGGQGANTYPSHPINGNYSKLQPGEMIICKSDGSRWIGKVM